MPNFLYSELTELLLNFGGRQPEYRRLYAHENDPTVGR